MFKPLTKANIGGIVDLIMQELNERLSDRQLRIELTPAAKQFVIDQGYDPVYGARPLRRYIQKNVETMAAKIILGGNIGEGSTITIDSDGTSLCSR
jgi:ATP-dependent Clp protease ATP-binding subunit ClpB